MALLPLFPLPDVVLFPGVLLPLHIFEPRYRKMVSDALSGDRRLGMVLLKPGWESDYEGRPPIFDTGCSAVIVHAVRLDDGRYNLVLRGLDRVRIVEEDHDRDYRRAAIDTLTDEPMTDDDRKVLPDLRIQLADRIGASAVSSGAVPDPNLDPLSSMPDAEFVHTIAQYVDLEPIEKQAVLECASVRLRTEALIELFEMKRLAGTSQPQSRMSH